VAVRTHSPILVSRDVFDEAGIVPEKDMQEEAPEETEMPPNVPPPAMEASPDDEKRLDVFEDFLKKLGGDKNEEEKPKD
jgi:bifunctional DNase/RNase